MKGKVKWYNRVKGYGFITSEEGNDIFVHHSSLKGDGAKKPLKEGQEVEFEVTDKEKGPAAADVVAVESE